MGKLLAFPSSPNDPYVHVRRYTPPYVTQNDNQNEEETVSCSLPLTGDEDDTASSERFDSAVMSKTEVTPTVWTRQALRDYILTNSPRSTQIMAKARQPFVGELIPFSSPEDTEVTFSIKRLNVRDVMAYRNQNSQVRYIMEEDNERVITEKDYPMGTMRVDVVMLGLANWNITDAIGNPVSVNRENIIAYLIPEELDALYDKVIIINPILSGEKARKNDSTTS